MERAGPAWRPQFQRESCAKGAPTRPEKARKGFVGARVILGHDGLAQGANSKAKVVDHGGDQGAAHVAAGHEGGKRDPMRRSEAQHAAGDARGGLPPRVIRQVAAERGARGGSHLPVNGSEQITIEQVTVDPHVIHDLGHVGALPGEDLLSGGVINTYDRRVHLIAGSHRLSGPCVDVLTGAKSRPQRRGARVRAENVGSVIHVRRVPRHKLRPALWRTKQTRSP